MEDDFLLEDEDDQKTIEFIKNYLPQDLKDKFTEDDLYYILDVIVDYYTSSGCLIYRSVIWEICTSPDTPFPRSTNAPYG